MTQFMENLMQYNFDNNYLIINNNKISFGQETDLKYQLEKT